VPFQPRSGVQKEVSAESVDTDEVVLELLVPDMPVISLSCLIVVTQDTCIIDDQHQPVFEIVRAAANRFGHTPDHDFRRRSIGDAESRPCYLYCVDHYHLPQVM
jgi:hypothetical protein